MMYGQFRSYKNNLQHNLKMLYPILKDYNVNVFIFNILSIGLTCENLISNILAYIARSIFKLCLIVYSFTKLLTK